MRGDLKPLWSCEVRFTTVQGSAFRVQCVRAASDSAWSVGSGGNASVQEERCCRWAAWHAKTTDRRGRAKGFFTRPILFCRRRAVSGVMQNSIFGNGVVPCAGCKSPHSAI